jgi:uncharacterized membrane protein
MFEVAIRIIPIARLILVCDLPWLYMSYPTAQGMIRKIQGGMPLEVRGFATIPVYLALAYLVQISKSTLEAGLIGLCTYAVYDFTNYSTLTNYSLEFAIADSMWGGILFMLVRELGIRLGLL